MRRNKYRAVRTTVDGITFASKKEAARYQELKLLERAGEIYDLGTQIPYDLIVNGIKVGRYIADFRYYGGPGHKRIVEDVKGFKTPAYQIKKKLMKALHGVEILET